MLIISQGLTVRCKSDTLETTTSVFIDIQCSFNRCFSLFLLLYILAYDRHSCVGLKELNLSPRFCFIAHVCLRTVEKEALKKPLGVLASCLRSVSTQELAVNGKNGNTEVWFCVLFFSTFLGANMNGFCYFQGLPCTPGKGDYTDACDRYKGLCRN